MKHNTPLNDPILAFLLVVFIVSVVGLFTSLLKGTMLGDFIIRANKGRLTIYCFVMVLCGFIFLHACNADFRESTNATFSQWFATVPVIDMVLLGAVIAGFVVWMTRKVKNP